MYALARRRQFLVFGIATVLCVAGPVVPATADNLDCGQPLSTGERPVASDCLFVLQAAVGSSTC